MDTFFVEKPNFDYFTLFIILYILIILGMFTAVSGFIAQASKLEEMITYTIRKQAFCKLQELSFSYFDVNSSGWILARLTSDTKKLASIVSWGIVDALWAVIVMLGKNAIPSKIEDITETSDKLIKEGYNIDYLNYERD